MSIWCHTQGAGEDVVVLHGWGMNANVWTPLLPHLSKSFTVTTVDLPGFGDSHNAVLAPSLAANVSPLLEVLPARFHLLGWSLGGLLAKAIALQAPDRVRSLATVAATPKFPQQESWPGIQAKLLAQFQQQLKQDFSKTIERFLAVQAMGSPHAKQQIKAVREWVFAKPMANIESLKNGLTLLESADLRTSLAQISQPFIRFYGRLDSLVPISAAAEVDRLATQSQSVIFDRCAHAPFLSATDEFARRYQEFVASV